MNRWSVCIFLGLLAGQWECPSVYIKEEEKDSLNKMESYIREKLTEHHIICDQLAFKESVNNYIYLYKCTIWSILLRLFISFHMYIIITIYGMGT